MRPWASAASAWTGPHPTAPLPDLPQGLRNSQLASLSFPEAAKKRIMRFRPWFVSSPYPYSSEGHLSDSGEYVTFVWSGALLLGRETRRLPPPALSYLAKSILGSGTPKPFD